MRSANNAKSSPPTPHASPPVRCAIYTRKSTDENLESSFNSLDAQREASENYIRSQQHEGWVALPERYDDGAISGATLERPALQRLLADVRQGKVDTIVIYKIDRLSRSLMDFTKLVEELEQFNVSLVSVTQQFNTTTSMGRLTMNILLSFAQFEREVSAERIRDKIAAEKKRGRWVGGQPPLGYEIDKANRRLVIIPDEAMVVRYVFRRFLQLRSMLLVAHDMNAKKYNSNGRPGKRPALWNKATVYRTLNNPAYVGLIRHHDQTYKGEHEAIIDQELWDEVHAILNTNPIVRGRATRSKSEALLRGLIRCGHCDMSMGITYTKKQGKQYRYYLCGHAEPSTRPSASLRPGKSGRDACPVKSIPAGDVEAAVMLQLRRIFQAPEILGEAFRVVQQREESDRRSLEAERAALEKELATLRTNASLLVQNTFGRVSQSGDGNPQFVAEELHRMEKQAADVQQKLSQVRAQLEMLACPERTTGVDGQTTPTSEPELFEELGVLDRVWGELFPAERERILRLMVESITVTTSGLSLVLPSTRPGASLKAGTGVASVLAELGADMTSPEVREKFQGTDGTTRVEIPMRFKHRSGPSTRPLASLRAGRKEILLPGSTTAEAPDATQESLVIAVARAYRWLVLLEEGRFNSVGELAEAVDMDSSQMRRHLALTSLAPALVRQILDGVEPDGLSLKQLLKGVEVVWEGRVNGQIGSCC